MRAMVFLILVLLFLSGCGKINETNAIVINPSEIDNFELLKSKNEDIVEYAIYDIIRNKNGVVYVHNLNISKEIISTMKSKNVTENSVVCLSDSDCPSDLKCLTLCEWIGEPWDRRIRVCRIDEWRDFEKIRFVREYGVCAKWNYLS